MRARRAIFSLIVFLIAAAVLIDGLSTSLALRRSLLGSVSEARENKRLFYTARNIEETFWQTLSETAAACPGCGQEELQLLTESNVALWKEFWKKEEGVDFSGGFPDPVTRFPVPGPEGKVILSIVPLSSGDMVSFSVQGGGLFSLLGNSTAAAILPGETRSCQMVAGKSGCEWVRSIS
jgi:hypothetical protein